MAGPILTVEDLAKHFVLHQQGRSIPGIRGVSFTVFAGRVTALAGPSGAGKSSILKCIHRTYLPEAGRILLNGHAGVVDLAHCEEREVLLARRHDLGFVTQFLHCLPRQPAVDVVAAPLVMRGVSSTEARERAVLALRRLDLPERLWDLPPATFSGGERQRVNLARGLVARPRLLLLDEPTASLDPQATDKAIEAIAGLAGEGVAILAIFHDPDLIDRLAQDVVRLARPEEAPCAA